MYVVANVSEKIAQKCNKRQFNVVDANLCFLFSWHTKKRHFPIEKCSNCNDTPYNYAQVELRAHARIQKQMREKRSTSTYCQASRNCVEVKQQNKWKKEN